MRSELGSLCRYAWRPDRQYAPLVAASSAHVCRSVSDLSVAPKLQNITSSVELKLFLIMRCSKILCVRAQDSAISLKALVKKFVIFHLSKLGCTVDLKPTDWRNLFVSASATRTYASCRVRIKWWQVDFSFPRALTVITSVLSTYCIPGTVQTRVYSIDSYTVIQCLVHSEIYTATLQCLYQVL